MNVSSQWNSPNSLIKIQVLSLSYSKALALSSTSSSLSCISRAFFHTLQLHTIGQKPCRLEICRGIEGFDERYGMLQLGGVLKSNSPPISAPHSTERNMLLVRHVHNANESVFHQSIRCRYPCCINLSTSACRTYN